MVDHASVRVDEVAQHVSHGARRGERAQHRARQQALAEQRRVLAQVADAHQRKVGLARTPEEVVQPRLLPQRVASRRIRHDERRSELVALGAECVRDAARDRRRIHGARVRHASEQRDDRHAIERPVADGLEARVQRRAPADADRHAVAHAAGEPGAGGVADDGRDRALARGRWRHDRLVQPERPGEAALERELVGAAGVELDAHDAALARRGEQPDHLRAAQVDTGSAWSYVHRTIQMFRP